MYEDRLGMRGIRNGEVSIPVPHSHHFYGELDDFERSLLAERDWEHAPLQDTDER